jgi:hypothetical protein
VGFGILWVFQNGEANIRLGLIGVIQGEASERSSKKESGVVRMFFNDLGDGFFRLGKILIKNGLFGGGDGGIKESVPICPF